MGSAFKSLKDFSSLNFNYMIFEDLTDWNLRRLSTWIHSLQRLKSLKVTFRFNFSKNLKYLSRGISRLKSLIRLQIVFWDTQKVLEDSHLKYLFSGVGKLEDLSELSLIFKECPKITSDCLLKSVGACLKKLDSLTKFSLMMTQCQGVTNEGLYELGQGLKSLKLLSVLKLDLNPCDEVKDLGMTSLAEGFKELKFLTSLDLNFDECPNVSNKGLCDLIIQLKNCRVLKTIVLKVKKNFKIGDESYIVLGSLLNELEELTEIDLNFSSCIPNTTEEGLQILFENLASLKNIQTLKLNFSKCTGSSNKNLLSLLSSMKTWTSLSDLALDFHSSSKITLEDIKAFCIALQDLGPLSTVHLMLPWFSVEIESEIRELLKNLECKEGIYNQVRFRSQSRR